MTTLREIPLPGVLRAHAAWLVNASDGCQADLSGATLHDEDLHGAKLSRAILQGATLLDANLAGSSAVPIAEALEARGVHYVVLSAVAFEQQPAGLRRGPFLRKPCRPAQLVRVLTDLCAKIGRATANPA